MSKAKEGKRKQISKYELLMKHVGEDSAYGDLADDVKRDKNFPIADSDNWEVVKIHLELSGASCDALDVADEFWNQIAPIERLEWKRDAMKISFDLSRKTGKNITLKRGNMMISANDRMHFQVKGKITQFLRELACYECKRTGLVPETPYSPSKPCTVAVTVRPPTARRNDAPNWYPTVKALIDGMTDAGVWTDDNNAVIKAMTFIAGEKSGTDRYRFELEVRDVRNSSDLS